MDGRLYYREVLAVESGGNSDKIWMDIDGVKTKIAEVSENESIYPVGAFNKHFYYSIDGF